MAQGKFRDKAVRAAAELTLIVVGVMIALAADGWKDDRADAARARDLTRLLIEDLRGDADDLAQLQAGGLSRDSAIAILMVDYDRGGLPADSVGTLLSRLNGSAMEYTARRSAYDALIQTDGLRLVATPEVRASLLDYYQRKQREVERVYGNYIGRSQEFQDVAIPLVQLRPSDVSQGLGSWTRWERTLAQPWSTIVQSTELSSALQIYKGYGQGLARRVNEAAEANHELQSVLTALQ